MQTCKVCGEKLALEERFRGTCKDCETAVAKALMRKVGQGFYSRKARLKF